MKKLILLALAPLAMLTVPAAAQPVEQRTVVHPNGDVTRTVTRGDGTVVHTERSDGDRTIVRTERRYGDDAGVRTERRFGDRRWEDRRHYGWRRGRAVQRCWTTWRHHQRIRVCNVRRGVHY